MSDLCVASQVWCAESRPQGPSTRQSVAAPASVLSSVLAVWGEMALVFCHGKVLVGITACGHCHPSHRSQFPHLTSTLVLNLGRWASSFLRASYFFGGSIQSPLSISFSIIFSFFASLSSSVDSLLSIHLNKMSWILSPGDKETTQLNTLLSLCDLNSRCAVTNQ